MTRTALSVGSICAFICSLLFLFSGCKKKQADTQPPAEEPVPETTGLQPGLPQNKEAVNGYLYCSKEENEIPGSSTHFIMNALFNDPAINLLATFDHHSNIQDVAAGRQGNIRAGDVRFAGLAVTSFTFSGGLFYTGSFTGNGGLIPTWHTEGNGAFKPLELEVTRDFPKISRSVIPADGFSLSASQDYTANLAGITSNCDSLSVQLSSGAKSVVKTTVPGNPVVVFSPADIAKINGSIFSPRIIVQAFNYSHKILAGKVYVFELASRLNCDLDIYP